MAWSSTYYDYDGMGNVVALTDESGQATGDQYVYSAFGELLAASVITDNSFLYNGRVGYYHDSFDTDEYYVRARTYAPTLARWLSADPLFTLPGQLHEALDIYAYVCSSPLSLTDPSGLVSVDSLGASYQLRNFTCPPSKKKKAKCCCCVTSLDIPDNLITDVGRNTKGSKRFGKSFTVVIGTEWKEHTEQLDCKLEWWEHLTIPQKGEQGETWIDRARPNRAGNITATLQPWKTQAKPCPGTATIKIKDSPSLAQGTGQNAHQQIFFAFKVSSAEGCDCPPENKSMVAFAQLTIDLDMGRGTGRTFQKLDNLPDPPGNPPGIK